MNIKLGNMKLSIALIMTIPVQAAGLIWYVASLDSQMNVNSAQIQELKEAHNLKINDLETRHKLAINDVDTDLKQYKELAALMLAQLEMRLADSEKVQVLIDNEMRTIMSDHSSFTDVLKELNKAGLLPSGEKREYGGYY